MFRYIADADAQYAHIKSLGCGTVDESMADTSQEIYSDVCAMESHCRTMREAAEKLTAGTARYLADQVEEAW